MDNPYKYLSREDLAVLTIALAVARGAKGFTTQEALKLTKWAETVSAQFGMLQLVLSGKAVINVENDTDDYSDIGILSVQKAAGESGAAQYKELLAKARAAVTKDAKESKLQDVIVGS